MYSDITWAMVALLTLTWKTNTNIESKIMFVTSPAIVVYIGIFVSSISEKSLSWLMIEEQKEH